MAMPAPPADSQSAETSPQLPVQRPQAHLHGRADSNWNAAAAADAAAAELDLNPLAQVDCEAWS